MRIFGKVVKRSLNDHNAVTLFRLNTNEAFKDGMYSVFS